MVKHLSSKCTLRRLARDTTPGCILKQFTLLMVLVQQVGWKYCANCVVLTHWSFGQLRLNTAYCYLLEWFYPCTMYTWMNCTVKVRHLYTKIISLSPYGDNAMQNCQKISENWSCHCQVRYLNRCVCVVLWFGKKTKKKVWCEVCKMFFVL